MEQNLLEVRNISKTFGVVKALDNIQFDVREDEIHALCGENGAGKSTLMNVLSGIYPHGTYEGQFFYRGEECRFHSIKDSEARSIAIIHQQLALIPALSIAENIFIGNENARGGVINWIETRRKAKELMEMVGLHEDPDVKIRDIGVGKQQLVEICKAMSKNVKLLILDEPTAALNDEESDLLLELLVKFKREQHISSILITHKLHEITKVADRITVIRDGKNVETLDCRTDVLAEDRIVKDMVGREMTNRFPEHRSRATGERAFEVKNWTVYDPTNEARVKIGNVSMHVNRGEILGIAGLMGAGRTELARSIFGRSYGVRISGTLLKDGQKLHIRNVSDAIEHGIGYVSEDRHTDGFIAIQSIKNNITLPSLRRFVRHGRVDENREILAAQEYREKLRIKAPSVEQTVDKLSGGNQQKVIFSKWLLTGSQVLILDEPTRGIDVGAKYEIYQAIDEMADAGNAVICISSDMTELIGLCDRVYVMSEGRFVGELTGGDITQENIMHCIIRNVEVADS